MGDRGHLRVARLYPAGACVTLAAMRRHATVIALAFLLLAAATFAFAAAPAAKPDVYLITVDTLRADHVGCYGDAKAATPALDGLCKDGVHFQNAFTPSPITNTSHASILTGLLPSSHGVTDFAIPLAASKATLAEMLHAGGYHTAAFIGAVILDARTLAPGFDRGFDFYFGFPQQTDSKQRYGRLERRADVVIARAEQWVAATRGPRFAWVHLYDPHDPYTPPEPYAAKYRENPYDGEIAYTDHALGGFLAFLKQRGLYDNAIILVVGDHGEGLGEHGEETHGIFLYDSTLHAPLIVKLPQQQARGTVIDPQVRTIDIAPTVVDLLRLATNSKFEGETLRPLWGKGAASSARVAFGETDYPLRFGWAPLRSVREEKYKYIEAPRPEFYALTKDPGETKNVYEPWSADVERLRRTLADAHLRRTETSSAVSAATSAELKALGYFPETRGETTATEPSLLPDPKDKIEEQNMLHRAMLADEDGDVAAARTALQQALRSDPRSPAVLLQLGQLELAAKNYPAAAKALETAREVRPEDAGAAWYLGQAYYGMADYPQARAALET